METLLSALQSLLIGIFIALALIFIVASILLLFFDTDSVKQRKLKQFAVEEYKKSRGTIHRQLLEGAARQINRQLDEYQHQIYAAEKQKEQCLQAAEETMRIEAAQSLSDTLRKEVPGVDDAMVNLILRAVSSGDLREINRSISFLQLGQTRQASVIRWVEQYSTRIPYLVRQNFPGKEAILRGCQQTTRALDSLIQTATDSQDPLRERLIPINCELSWLKEVRVADFIQAYQDPDFDRWDEVDRYLKGVFAEWEPIPNWFLTEVGSEVS